MFHFVCFSTMKFSRGFSILILLFILQASIAVQCPNAVELIVDTVKKTVEFVFSGSKTCDACAYFACADIRMCGGKVQTVFDDVILGMKGIKYGAGCPEDFYAQCSEFSSDIDFIRNKSANEIDYKYNFTNPEVPILRVVSYVAGCGGETDGTKCIKEHAFRSEKEFQDAEELTSALTNTKNRMLYWKVGTESSGSESSDNGKCSDNGGVSNVLNVTEFNNVPSYDPNGALKFLGIIAIGWNLVAYIY